MEDSVDSIRRWLVIFTNQIIIVHSTASDPNQTLSGLITIQILAAIPLYASVMVQVLAIPPRKV
jgi:hypothetical protein